MISFLFVFESGLLFDMICASFDTLLVASLQLRLVLCRLSKDRAAGLIFFLLGNAVNEFQLLLLRLPMEECQFENSVSLTTFTVNAFQYEFVSRFVQSVEA